MANKRAEGKVQFGGWIPVTLRDLIRSLARSREITDTDALIESLTDWAEHAKTTETPTED